MRMRDSWQNLSPCALLFDWQGKRTVVHGLCQSFHYSLCGARHHGVSGMEPHIGTLPRGIEVQSHFTWAVETVLQEDLDVVRFPALRRLEKPSELHAFRFEDGTVRDVPCQEVRQSDRVRLRWASLRRKRDSERDRGRAHEQEGRGQQKETPV